jgi:hypothetical protein
VRTAGVRAFLHHAIDKPGERLEVVDDLMANQVGAPPGNWPLPPDARERARAPCLAAAEAAREFMTENGVSILHTTELPELPEVSVAWHLPPAEYELPVAPLVHYLADVRARYMMADLASQAFSRYTATLWDPDNLARKRRPLNAFARLEITLWSYAAKGGYVKPPPYAVRYDVARWLWHPSIAGSIFCLRCGDELRYLRSQRTARDAGGVQRDSRTARCRACARGAEDDWPAHALEPHRRGTWLLRCQFSDCTQPFDGRRHALYCPRHRASRMSPRRRTEGRRHASGP